LNIIPVGLGQLLAGLAESPVERSLILGPTPLQALFQDAKRGGPDEDE
jgi:hypothetical protein